MHRTSELWVQATDLIKRSGNKGNYHLEAAIVSFSIRVHLYSMNREETLLSVSPRKIHRLRRLSDSEFFEAVASGSCAPSMMKPPKMFVLYIREAVYRVSKFNNVL